MARQRRLEVVIAGDATGLQNAFDKAGGVVGGFGSKLGGFAKGAVASIGAAFAVDQVLSFGGQMLSLGGQLEAIATKVSTVFEGQTADIRRWADQNNEAFGLTDDQLAGLAANFGDLLKPMGFTAEQAAGMSKDVIGLAGALSAWTGGQIGATEVADILSAAMLGERDALQQLGISISQAEIDAILAAKGQQELTGAALQQAEALATQELLFAKSTDAQRAWAEGGNEALTAQNRLKAGFGELQERLANGLVPAILTVVGLFERNVMPVIEEVVGGIVSFVGAFRNAEDGVTSSGFAGFMENLAIRAREAFDSISAKVEEWWPKVQAAFQVVVDWVRENWPEIRRTAEETLLKVQELWASVFAAIQAIVGTVVAVVMDMWDRFGEQFLARLMDAFRGVMVVVQGLYTFLIGIFNLITAVLTGEWGKAWEAIKQILAGAWQVIQGIIDLGINGAKASIEFVLAAISAIWSFLWNAMSTLLSDIWAGIQAGVGAALDGIVSFFAGLPGRLLALVAAIGGAAASIGLSIADGIVNAITGVPGVLGDIAGRIWEAIKSIINSGIGAINDLIPNRIDLPGPIPDIDLPDNPFRTLHTGGVVPGTLHTGGVVPGTLGEEVLVKARAGERYSTDPVSPLTDRRQRAGGPLVGTMIVQSADPDRAGRSVVDELTWMWRVAG